MVNENIIILLAIIIIIIAIYYIIITYTKHKSIIERFGRYPHRNEILGRTSTVEEIEFLNGPDSSF